MKDNLRVAHRFVDVAVRRLDEHLVYVCIPYATVLHLCPCGCAAEIVTPLSPADWEVTFDGEAISLYPSIGNWSLKCRSHYWIRDDEVIWAPSWTDVEIEDGRKDDRRAREKWFDCGTRGQRRLGRWHRKDDEE